jgi:nucleotide-binding universal stress UspA family protein
MIIPEIKKILYATDLSENARYSFSYAASIAHRYGAAITILHVLETHTGYAYDLSSYLGSEKWEEIRKSHEEETINTIKTRLAKFCEDAAGEHTSCSFTIDGIVVKTGNPVEETLLQVETGNFDLVVMGRHGHGALAEAMMGSTARRVLRRCKKPVLVVRLPEGDD